MGRRLVVEAIIPALMGLFVAGHRCLIGFCQEHKIVPLKKASVPLSPQPVQGRFPDWLVLVLLMPSSFLSWVLDALSQEPS